MDLHTYGLKPLNFNAEPVAADSAVAGLSRRAFIMTSLAIGFAIASNPIMAQAIVTSDDGLVAGEVSVPTTDGKIPAYRAMPKNGKNLSVVLVIQEIFGVHEHIKDVCRRFAKLGYYAIAPELFARQGDVSNMTDIGEILSKVVSKVPDEQVFSDLDATVAYVKSTGKANAKKLATLGFCWGGRTVWLYATHNPNVKAGIAYYGPLTGMKSDIKANDPMDIASTLKAPILGLYASQDAFIKNEMIEQMQAELEKSGSHSEIIVFPNVNHGFHADYRPTYNKTAADYSWQLTRDWLKKHGV